MDIKFQEAVQGKPIEVFCCYASKDQALLSDLKTHLMPLQQERLITLCADTDVSAGRRWKKEIHRHLNAARIILLLISPDFLASEYYCSVEMQRAIERHENGEAHVIPIILRPVAWQKTPLGKLQALPTDAKPITKWDNQDEAFCDVAQGLRDTAEVCKAVETEQARLADKQILHSKPGSLTEAKNGLSHALHTIAKSQVPQRRGIKVSRRTVIVGGIVVAGAIAAVTADEIGKLLAHSETHSESGPGIILYTYQGNFYQVRSIAWSPDGKHIAAAIDNVVHVWDALTGKNALIYDQHTCLIVGNFNECEVLSVAWSPNSRYIVSGGRDNTAQIWNAHTGERFLVYHGSSNRISNDGVNANRVMFVTWSPDSRHIASVSWDGTQIWDALTGELIYTHRGNSNSGDTVATWSPDGKRVASGDWDGTVQVWEALNGKNIFTHNGPSNPDPNSALVMAVESVAWSPNGKYIASALSYNNTIQVFDATTGKNIFTNSGQKKLEYSVVWSLDSKYIASGGYNAVQIWDALTGKLVLSYDEPYPPALLLDMTTSVTLSPDGKYIASAFLGKTATVQVRRVV